MMDTTVILFIVVVLLLVFYDNLINSSQLKPFQSYIEGYDTFDPSTVSGPNSFCSHYQPNPKILNNKSQGLTKTNCMNTRCTVWTEENGCVAGNSEGPTYRTDSNQKPINIDAYYYMNKCYGNCNN